MYLLPFLPFKRILHMESHIFHCTHAAAPLLSPIFLQVVEIVKRNEETFLLHKFTENLEQ